MSTSPKKIKRGPCKNVRWESVAVNLNSLGSPLRNGKEWQKSGSTPSLKKQKLLFNKKEGEATGGGPLKKKIVSDLEEVIIRLLSLDQDVNPTGYAAGGSFYSTPESCSRSLIEPTEV